MFKLLVSSYATLSIQCSSHVRNLDNWIGREKLFFHLLFFFSLFSLYPWKSASEFFWFVLLIFFFWLKKNWNVLSTSSTSKKQKCYYDSHYHYHHHHEHVPMSAPQEEAGHPICYVSCSPFFVALIYKQLQNKPWSIFSWATFSS